MLPFRTQKRTVWLITWEYTRDDYFEHLGRRTIAAVLDSRVSDDFVRRYLPLLYSTERELLNFEKYGEMYLQSLRRYRNPDWKDVRGAAGALSFGGHPWLNARKVDGFFIDVFDYETESVYWTEREGYRAKRDGEVELLRPRRHVKLTSNRGDRVTERLYFGDDAIPPKKPRKKVE
jgi:hypothetical protein